MSDVIIRAEGLGKKYLIGHQAESQRYVALRDVAVRNVKAFARSAREMLRGRQIVAGDEVEEFWALKDVNFEIKRGDVVGLIGRNGAGKSTLLKLLSRITEPSAGRVEIKGRVASLLEVGTGFHPELTGRENIYLNGAILGMTRAEIKRKFDEIVDFAEVEKFLDTPVKRYSSGMYVRLAFAVAAHLEPEILVVDEVLAVGDAEFQKKCLGKIGEVAGNGRTVLFVSHNMGAIQQLCARGIMLDSGTLAFQGEAGKAIEKYSSMAHEQCDVVFSEKKKHRSITAVRVDKAALKNGDLVVEIDIMSKSQAIIPYCGLVLRSATGIPVWGTNARFHPPKVEMLPAMAGTVVCAASNLPMVTGQYTLSIWFGDWEVDYDNELDVLTFQFKDGVVHPMRPPTSAQGYLDWDADWSFAPRLSTVEDIHTNCADRKMMSVDI